MMHGTKQALIEVSHCPSSCQVPHMTARSAQNAAVTKGNREHIPLDWLLVPLRLVLLTFAFLLAGACEDLVFEAAILAVVFRG